MILSRFLLDLRQTPSDRGPDSKSPDADPPLTHETEEYPLGVLTSIIGNITEPLDIDYVVDDSDPFLEKPGYSPGEVVHSNYTNSPVSASEDTAGSPTYYNSCTLRYVAKLSSVAESTFT